MNQRINNLLKRELKETIMNGGSPEQGILDMAANLGFLLHILSPKHEDCCTHVSLFDHGKLALIIGKHNNSVGRCPSWVKACSGAIGDRVRLRLIVSVDVKSVV